MKHRASVAGYLLLVVRERRSRAVPGASGVLICHPELAEGSLTIFEMNDYYVYILTNERDKLLYIGVTNSLRRRMYEHRNGVVEGFTKDYRIDKLVYYEMCHNVEDAIRREKQLKKWRREKKIQLIEQMNPYWKDLGEGI